MTFRHPGIDMVENLRARGDRDDDAITSRLRMEKSALNLAMERTSQEDASKLDPKDITMLRGYEVALAYLSIHDPQNMAAQNKLRCAIDGKTPTGQPSESSVYNARREHAITTNSPQARVTTHLDF